MPCTSSGTPIEILLVEDNPGDVRLIEEVLREGQVHVSLRVVEDGVEALAFLHRQGPYAHAPRPNLILLDLSLPKKDGLEVLAEIKNDPHLRRLPVVVLTTSEAEEDIVESYNRHANCYITKAMDLGHFVKVVQSIEAFWFTIVQLPSG